MKPAITLNDLIKDQNFGVNIIIKEAKAKLSAATFVAYSLDPQKAMVRYLREHPLQEGKFIHDFAMLKRTTQPENIAFFNKLNDGTFWNHDVLDSDDFKDEFLPLYEAHLEQTLGYGDSPVLVDSVHTATSTYLTFETTKTYSEYDAAGEIVTTEKVKKHRARWELQDPKVDFNNTIVIPRPLITSLKALTDMVAEILEIDPSRFYFKQDITDPTITKLDIWFVPTELIYVGKLEITVTPAGTAYHVYNNLTGEEIVDTDDEGGEGNTESDQTPVVPPEPVTITDLTYDVPSKTLHGLVTGATQVKVSYMQTTATATVVDGILTYPIADDLVPDTVITVTSMDTTVTATTTVPA